MLGGMWGVRGGLPMSIRTSISECANDDTALLVDQILPGNKVGLESNAIRDVFIHRANEKTLNTNIGLDFVGQGYDENDAPIYK